MRGGRNGDPMTLRFMRLAALAAALSLPGAALADTGGPRTDIYLKPWAQVKHRAERGDAEAQFELAYLYYASGEDERVQGIIHSERLAARWYRKAALQGHVGARYNMAALYVNGEGVEQDAVEAYAWALLAAADGHEGAGELVTALGRSLDPMQQDAGRRRAEALERARS